MMNGMFDWLTGRMFVGLWHWQTAGVAPSETSPNNGGAAGVSAGGATSSTAGHAPPGSELVTDMLQMLDHSGTSGFEDLNMFSSNFEWLCIYLS